MKTRACAFALALLFAVSAAVTAAPGACCAPVETEQAVSAVDCCATMGECPLQLKAAGPAVVQPDGQGFTMASLAAAPESPATVGLSYPDPRFQPGEVSYAGPPLYRLHAQLLI